MHLCAVRVFFRSSPICSIFDHAICTFLLEPSVDFAYVPFTNLLGPSFGLGYLDVWQEGVAFRVEAASQGDAWDDTALIRAYVAV